MINLSVTYIVLLYVSTCTAIMLAWLSWQRRKQPGAFPLFILSSGIAVLTITSYLEVMARSLAAKEFWVNMQYLGYNTIPVALFLAVLQYMGIQKRFTLRHLAVLLFIPSVTILLLWTNDYHHLMRYGAYIQYSDGLGFLGKKYGAWFWVNYAYMYTLMLTGLALLVRAFIRGKSFYRRQLILIIAGAALPIVFNLLFSLRRSSPMDLSPAIMCLGCALISISILQFRFFEIKPIAYDLIIHSAREGVIILDANNIVVDINSACEEMLSIKESDVIGKRYDSALSPYSELVNILNLGDIHSRREVEVRDSKGSKYLELRLSLLTNKGGRLLGRLAAIEDITERKRREEELRAAKIELEAALANAEKLADEAKSASVAKSQFIANMSHEIRTPLNGVIGMIRLLLDTNLDDTQREYAELAETSSTALFEVVNDILDFSKIEAGKLDLEMADFDLHPVVKSVEGMLAGRVREKGISYESHISPEVPSILHGDKARLRQVLANLVGNAVKFTETGGVDVQVRLENRSRETAVLRFEVKDTGIGISPEKIESLFHAFSQEDGSINRRFGGTGLGLTISRKLVAAMGGEIGVNSIKGKGSTFWFTVPFGAAVKSSGKDIPGSADESVDLHDFRILLAEDNPVNQRLAVILLKKMGCTVDVVQNGLEAVNALKSEEYDLVLMDVQMPDMDGLEATRVIRDKASDVINHDIPVVAMTAMAVKDDREECLAAGMNGYISKPVDAKLLASVIQKYAATAKQA